MATLFKGLYNALIKYLMKTQPYPSGIQLSDFERLRYEIRPCDVLLVSGQTRISNVIKTITQSHWSHAALYIGRLYDIESDIHREQIIEKYQYTSSEQLVIESEIGRGTIVTPLNHYQGHHSRICRPIGLLRQDAQNVINYAIEHIGREYNIRQILDLARFLFPWSLFPRQWHSSLFAHNAGKATQDVCSTLIAEAFESVNFPILPMIKSNDDKKIEYVRRNPRLFTPSDFDFSPYFDIIKYPIYTLEGQALYQYFPWNKEIHYSDTRAGKIYTPRYSDKSDVEKNTLENNHKHLKQQKSKLRRV